MNFTSCAELECTVFERTVNAAVFAMLLIKFFFKRSSDVICSALAWTWHREELRPQFALLRAFSAPFRCCSRISGSTRCQCVTCHLLLSAAMGLTISSLFSRLFGKKQMRILMGKRGLG